MCFIISGLFAFTEKAWWPKEKVDRYMRGGKSPINLHITDRGMGSLEGANQVKREGEGGV